ncbi:uncharacterized protein DUF1643 [Paraburkholderia sp. BL10I2N1]|nr:uncharacterized protein DUF1643 [Paraburkholderia sp. BL10I2N1]
MNAHSVAQDVEGKLFDITPLSDESARQFMRFVRHSGEEAQCLIHRDLNGSLANASILEAVDRASIVICAWGSHEAAARRAADVLHLLRITSMSGKLFHLGLNRDGSPKHPLYIASSTRPKPFSGVEDV